MIRFIRVFSDSVKPKTCLVFMNDSDQHLKVVLKMSAFIRKHCANDVEAIDILDQSFSQFGALVSRLGAVHRVIAVHSEGRKRHPADEMIKSLVPQNGIFNKVMEVLQKTGKNKKNYLIHVSFHYASPDLVRNVNGTKFRLIAQMAEFMELLNDRMAPACTNCVEGAELFQAFVEAGGLPWYFFETTIKPPVTGVNPDKDNASIDSDILELGLSSFETDAESDSTSDRFQCVMDQLIHGRHDCCVQRQISNVQHEIVSMLQ